MVVLLHRPETARRAASARASADEPPVSREGRPAQLRHRRADPARPRRRQDAPAGEAAQDAEHGRLRSRGDRLRRAAAAAQGVLSARALAASSLRLVRPIHHAHSTHSPNASGDGRRVGIVLSRFNRAIGDAIARRCAARARGGRRGRARHRRRHRAGRARNPARAAADRANAAITTRWSRSAR